MNVRRILKVMAVTMTLCLAASPCYAARIYNELSFPIIVERVNFLGLGDNSPIFLIPGQKSDSLEWNEANSVLVIDGTNSNKKVLCDLEFGSHYQIVGGNYMVVSASGNDTKCVVCDSNHNAIVGAGNC
jgi:hypothetical protein